MGSTLLLCDMTDPPLYCHHCPYGHFESSEEGTRNVVAECVGKLTLLDPDTLLPRLKVRG